MMLLYYYWKYSAAGVVKLFVSAKVAGGDRPTAVMNAAGPHSVKHIKGIKENTAGQKKGKKFIVRLRISAGWD